LYNRAQTQIEEAYRQIEAQFTAEKMQQLTHLLEEFIALGNSRQEAIPGDNE
ncbi:homoprotocatechuate degradation operon regulator HpaR, partial [Escherichia coli]